MTASKSHVADLLTRRTMAVITFLFLYVYIVVNGPVSDADRIRSDGVGYYVYLPSYIIHHDPSFEAVARSQYGGEIPGWSGVIRSTATGRLGVMYNVGVAVMMLPFFLVAHGLSLMLGLRADGYAPMYQHAALVSGLVYTLLGLKFLRQLLLKWFKPEVVAYALVAIVLGTNLLHYAAAETVMSHDYSFFLFAAFLCATRGWYEREGRWGASVQLGVLAGMIPLVRTPNALFLMCFPLYGILSAKDVGPRAMCFLRRWKELLVVAACAALVFLPQCVIWKYTFGAWVANSYQGLHPDLVLTHFSSPRIADVLISLRAGILFWCPVVALTLPGFFLLKRYAPDVLLPAAAFMVSEVYLIASWHDWAFGGGFGHRGFVECYAVLVFPLAAFFAAVAASPRRWLRQAVGVLVVAMIAHVLFFMTLYHTREISCYGLDRQALFDIFWWRYHAIMSWCALP